MTTALKSIKEAYRQFLCTPPGCDAYANFKQMLYSGEDSLIENLNSTVFQHLLVQMPRSLRICDVGGGDGRRVTRVANYCIGKFSGSPLIDFVEQSGEMCSRYNQLAGQNTLRTRIFHSLFEDAPLIPGSYDLVLLVHSMFAFENQTVVKKLLSLLRQGGAIVAVSNADDSFLGGLKCILDDGFDDRRFELVEFEASLRGMGVAYTKTTFSTRWAVPSDEMHRSVEILLEWLTVGAKHRLTQQRRLAVGAFVAANTSLSDGRLVFCEEEAVIVIR